jgi:hypothetical protein
MSFHRSSYRRPLEKEPAGGIHRRFEITATAGRLSRRPLNRDTQPMEVDITVRIAFSRRGGDAASGTNRGDRLGVNDTAAADTMLIADALIDIRNWNQAVTKLRDVRFLGMTKTTDTPDLEVWTLRFTAEYLYKWTMLPTGTI